MREDTRAVRWTLWRLTVLGIAALICAASRPAWAQDDGSTEVVPGMEDACIENFGYTGCTADGMPKPPGGGQQLIVVHFTAVAISPTTMTAGASHGQNSQSSAEQTALQTCRRNGATDCKVLTWAENACIGLAESYADKAYGFYVGSSRDESAAGALARCQSGHGKNCVTVHGALRRRRHSLVVAAALAAGRVNSNGRSEYGGDVGALHQSGALGLACGAERHLRVA